MPTSVSTEEERTACLEAIEEALRPLMRVVFEYGCSYQNLADVMRGVYISELQARLEAHGRAVTEARLGLMAGVTRGEVATLLSNREKRAQQRAVDAKRTAELGQLLSLWHDDSRFSTPYGAPLDLSLQPGGTFRTLDELIKESGITLEKDSVIQHLVKVGCIEVHGREFIRCVSRSILSANADVTQIAHLGKSSASLNATLVHNLLCEDPADTFFERNFLTDFPLSDGGKSWLQSQLKVEGTDFITQLDRWVSGKGDEYAVQSGRRYGVTMFFFDDGPMQKQVA